MNISSTWTVIDLSAPRGDGRVTWRKKMSLWKNGLHKILRGFYEKCKFKMAANKDLGQKHQNFELTIFPERQMVES